MNVINKTLQTLIRFQSRALRVLNINKRNLSYIYQYNARIDYPVADNKLLTKKCLITAGVPVTETYLSYSHFYQLSQLVNDLHALQEFVIKPAQGRGGGGIIVIVARTDTGWLGINEKHYTVTDIKRHISDIIYGVYSFDTKDQAIIEARIHQHHAMNTLSPFGLSDVRLILFNDKPVMAMTRLPTKSSGGRANIHQGAIGAGIDIATGRTTHAIHHNEPITKHPDTGIDLIDRQIPYWHEIISMGIKAATAVPLKYIGADIAVTDNGPVIIELNVRPGLAIQAANNQGMAELLQQLA